MGNAQPIVSVVQSFAALRLSAVLCALYLAAGCTRPHDEPSAATQPPGAARNVPLKAVARPVPAIDRVMIISVDGLRPDVLLRAEMPRVRGLCRSGSFSFWAETAPEAYTLPCHLSMLTGTPAEQHGVTWNDYIEESYSNVPTLFEIARQAGYSTAVVAGKMKFIVLLKPNTIDHYYLPPDEPVSDREVAERAESILHQHRPQVVFIHLPGVDTAGHEFGWGSTEQIAAAARADEAVGLLLDALANLKLTDSTLVILTADHGGAGKNHVADDPRSHFIPWIASGPGLRQDFDLTLASVKTIRIEDTFATACCFLGIHAGEYITGKPVLELLDPEHPVAGDKSALMKQHVRFGEAER